MEDEKQAHGHDHDTPQEVRKFTRENVAKMISAQRQEWEEEWKVEAKHLARLSAEEKPKHEVKKGESGAANDAL